MAQNPKRSPKSAKQTAARTKGKHRKETGIDNAMAHFFLGGEDKVAGRMHYKPPRWTGEYETMKVSDLVRRILGDLDELCARAYPTATPYYGQTKHRLLPEECRHAANGLAFLTQHSATYLENLSFKQRELMRDIARARNLWPVNLGLKWKIVKGKATPRVTRSRFISDYLTDLALNSQPNFPSSHESGAEPVSPFRLAAEELYTKMLLLKRDYRLWFPKLTGWAKSLLALKVPMTKSNAAEW